MEAKKILLVEDDPNFGTIMKSYLEMNDYLVSLKVDGKQGLAAFRAQQFDICILDVMMPEMDGIAACEEIRKLPGFRDVVIAFLTARGEDYSQIAGFDAGADDYITKPIRPKVLISRVKALLKRSGGASAENVEQDKVLHIGNLIIDKEKYTLQIDDREMMLPRKEFELLSLLVSKPDKVFLRDEIYKSVWGDNVIVGDRTIDVHIRKLREKIGNDHIRTLKGIGYKFVV